MQIFQTEVYGWFGKSANGNISDIETPTNQPIFQQHENLARMKKVGMGETKFDLSLTSEQLCVESLATALK